MENGKHVLDFKSLEIGIQAESFIAQVGKHTHAETPRHPYTPNEPL